MRLFVPLLIMWAPALAQQEPEGRPQFITASLAYHDNRFDDCVSGYQKTIALHHEIPFSKMMISRCLGLKGDVDAAMDALDEAAEFEFANAQTLLNDPEFATHRAHPRFAGILAKVRTNTDPCQARKRRRAMDFWVGTWDVQRANGQLAGTDQIEMVQNGCLLQESWTGAAGDKGQSITFYDKWTGYWRQTWMDPTGIAFEYTGDFEGESLVLRRVVYNGGTKTTLRVTISSLPDGGIRQLTERNFDDDPGWTITSDLKFVRRQ